MTSPVVDLVLLWHHHQPDYRSPREGRSVLPWVRLHATKDYLDMARHLARHPGVHATFNFVPSLLDQLEAAATDAPDALFDLLRRPVEALSADERAEVLRRCVVAPRHAFDRWSRYRALARHVAETHREGGAAREATDEEVRALECWFLLAWIDPSLLGEPEAEAALAAAGDFDEAHRDGLLALSRRLTSEVVPAYRALADRGQVELSCSAYYHPILPLLIDVRSARRARPDLPLPAEPFAAPDDAASQLARGRARHARAFGAEPAGLWPSEGSVSPEVAALAARTGVRWVATDEGVLWRSLPAGERRRDALYRPWRFATPDGDVHVLFRDHELSDRIGFVYHHWDPDEAVADFLARIRRIGREARSAEPPVVSVMLDGENCWEHYPADGQAFLDRLYAALAEADDIRTRTVSEAIAGRSAETLPDLHSGSWIDADFHIWIGHPEKNRAWELLARARRALTERAPAPGDAPEAWEALWAAEGSDWFWWFGDDHFTTDKDRFDRLFREHLQGVYERARLDVPAWLLVPIAAAARREDSSTRPLGFVRPTLDGRPTQFYEWHAAGRHRLGAGGGSMHHGAPGWARDLYHGFDATTLYLRLDFTAPDPPGADVDLVIELLAPRADRVLVRGLVAGNPPVSRGGSDGAARPLPDARGAIGSVLELGLPFAALDLAAGESVEMLLHLVRDGEPLERLPADDLVRFTVPTPEYEASMWSA